MESARLSGRWAGRLTGILLSVIAVGLVTGAVYALRPIAPVLSLGVLYVIAVVAVAVLRGLAYAVPVSVASMLVFNFLFLPPVHTFALSDSANWIALGVYIATAVVVSELATRSRRLAQQAVEAETLRQSDAAKTAVLRAVSHDLRSPLTAIRAASEGLSSSEFELQASDRDELFESIRIEVRRLERLVDNLLDLSRLEAGPALRRPEVWPVDLLVARALEQLGDDAARVVVALDADLEPVRADATHVERVLVNLLENALKFSSPADTVEVSAARTDARLSIRIRDHGPGVIDADRERIFEPFERGTGSASGTGLGLAIARGFAEANAGRLQVERGSPAGGSVFVLELPVVDESAALRR
jgi:K+-sensing histidine kinase KdpD